MTDQMRLFDVEEFAHDALLAEFADRAAHVADVLRVLASEFEQLPEVFARDRNNATLAAVAKIEALPGLLGLEGLLMVTQRLSNAGR